MTEEEYVAKRGCCCPICGTDDIQMDGGLEYYSETEEPLVVQVHTCKSCGMEWCSRYKLIGYDLLWGVGRPSGRYPSPEGHSTPRPVK